MLFIFMRVFTVGPRMHGLADVKWPPGNRNVTGAPQQWGASASQSERTIVAGRPRVRERIVNTAATINQLHKPFSRRVFQCLGARRFEARRLPVETSWNSAGSGFDTALAVQEVVDLFSIYAMEAGLLKRAGEQSGLGHVMSATGTQHLGLPPSCAERRCMRAHSRRTISGSSYRLAIIYRSQRWPRRRGHVHDRRMKVSCANYEQHMVPGRRCTKAHALHGFCRESVQVA